MRKIAVLIIILLMINSCSFFEKEKESVYQREKDKLVTFLTDKTNYTYELAKMIALDKDIVSTYSMLKTKVGNIAQIRNEYKDLYYKYGNDLKEVFLTKIRLYEGAIDVPLTFHFLLYPARSWVQPDLPRGEDITLQDLSKTRAGILEVINKNTYSSDYEVMPDGLFYRTIMPIWGVDGETLGAVEVRVEVSSILLNYLQNNPERALIVFLDNRFKDLLTKSKTNIGDSIVYISNLELSNDEYKNIYNAVKNIKKQEKIIFMGKDFVFLPLNDEKKDLIGYILISLS